MNWRIAETGLGIVICCLFAIGCGYLTVLITGEWKGWQRQKCRWCAYRGSAMKVTEHEALDHPDDWQQWQR